jgi:hypothetical protein
MSAPTHPSPESLSAYFDQELPADERQPIDAHVTECAACRAELDAFAVMSELGPAIEDILPGEAYWKDLPDRILARLANPGTVAPASAPAPSWWQRLLHPEGRVRVAWGAAALVAVTVGAWALMEGKPNPWRPAAPEVAQNLGQDAADQDIPEGASSSLGNEVLPDYVNRAAADPTPTPQSYIRRVYTTYGDRNNMGTMLDVAEGEIQNARGLGLGEQVTETLPGYGPLVRSTEPASINDVATALDLGPQARESAQGVVQHGCGEEDPIEITFLAALKAEESGNYDMARQGFLIVRSKLAQNDGLRHEAEFHLQYMQWRQRLEAALVAQRVQAMSELNRLANASYKDWERTQGSRDCQEAWCMNRVLLNLAPELADQSQTQVMLTRVNKLKNCVE